MGRDEQEESKSPLGVDARAETGALEGRMRRPTEGAALRTHMSVLPVGDSVASAVAKDSSGIDDPGRGEAVLRRHLTLLEQTQVPMFVWELDGTITYWNRGAEETYGFSRSEAVGHDVQDLLRTACSRAALVEALERYGRWSGELTKRHRDGTPVVVESRMTLSRDGGVGFVLETNLPITERKMREEAAAARVEELAETDRNKNEFLAVLAHELRNPLASLRNAVQVVRLAKDADVRRQAEETLERQSSHMMRLVDDLLDVSRITRGEIRLKKEVLELNALIARVAESAVDEARRSTRRFSIELSDEPIYVEGDAVRLEQLFTSLLSNAWKFTRDGGQVWIHAQREIRGDGQTGVDSSSSAPDTAVVRVCDDGIGMHRDALERVFEMFVQLDRSTARSAEGLGIGLTLARSVARLHGGDIEAHSRGYDQGSEFVVRLPAIAERVVQVRPADDTGTEVSMSPSKSSCVVVVDDNVDTAAMMSALLRLAGHAVEVAHDGMSAIATVERFKPEVVLLDIGMPGMDGYEIARRLRGSPGGDELLLIALTGYTQPEHVAATREAGFDYHLTKPVDHDVVRNLIAKLQKRPQPRS
jgi:two-component system CheB/CheR fusion protein